MWSSFKKQQLINESWRGFLSEAVDRVQAQIDSIDDDNIKREADELYRRALRVSQRKGKDLTREYFDKFFRGLPDDEAIQREWNKRTDDVKAAGEILAKALPSEEGGDSDKDRPDDIELEPDDEEKGAYVDFSNARLFGFSPGSSKSGTTVTTTGTKKAKKMKGAK
tara:strand:- start:312 stop:809 length:498 start_codon:yes stop_codon:yes gene_type:complete